jgi:hypothetical protein
MPNRERAALLSLTISTMFTASLLAEARLGPIAAAAGPQVAPAVLEQALANVRADGWNAPPAAPAAAPAAAPMAAIVSTPASAPRAILTDAELKKIAALTQKYGEDQTLSARVTQILGLTRAGETLAVRQLGANDDNDVVHYHYFNRSKTDPSVIILIYQDKGSNVFYGYRTDAKFSYISGYNVASSGSAGALTPQQGAAGLDAEIRWWAKTVDAVPN